MNTPAWDFLIVAFITLIASIWCVGVGASDDLLCKRGWVATDYALPFFRMGCSFGKDVESNNKTVRDLEREKAFDAWLRRRGKP